MEDPKILCFFFCKRNTILPYDSRPIPTPEKQATSPAFPGRRISRTDGPDLAFPGHFANKSSDFIEINPRSNILSQKILQKNPKYFSKSTRGPTSSLSSFCKKKTQTFHESNLPSKSSWAGLPLAPSASVGRIRPDAGLSYLLFFSNYE